MNDRSMNTRRRPAFGARAVIWLIGLYQRVMVGSTPRCRFAPSCSEYALQAVEAYGLVRGGWMGMKRIGRCHPWHPGGYDPVVNTNSSSVLGR